jgi:hypothetical protein
MSIEDMSGGDNMGLEFRGKRWLEVELGQLPAYK